MEYIITYAFHGVTFILFIYSASIVLFYSATMAISSRQLRRRYELNIKEPYEDILDSADTKPISIIVPAYNEEVGVVGSVRALLSVNYPEIEIIVVNDGSKDRTFEVMIDSFSMMEIHPVLRSTIEAMPIKAIYRSRFYDNVYMIDKANGGKADALNAGINFAHYPYICSIDGDSILEQDALLKVMKPIIESNGDVIAAGGSIRIANGCKIERGEVMNVGLPRSGLAVMQVIEYLRGFLIGRIGLSRHNLLLIISGAFGVFQKEWLFRVGGYRTNTVGEDMELVVRLHRLIREQRLKKRIEYVPDPVCWTEAPETLRILRRQRNRWHRGLFESLWLHRIMLLNPRYGLIGLVSMPYFLFVELLGPLIEMIGYLLILIGVFTPFIDFEVSLLLFFLSYCGGSILSMGAVLLEEWSLRKYSRIRDLLWLFVYAVSESFWYRPLTVYWRMEGLAQLALYPRKTSGKHAWGEMTRKGISE